MSKATTNDKHMKSVTTLLLVLAVTLTVSCSKSGSDTQQTGNSKQEAFSESQVIAIVDAVIAKDAGKVKAMLEANPKLVKAKLTSGGSVDGWPLLMIASRQGDKPIVELLLGSGADVNDKNFSGEVALHYAALHGHKQIVQLLLDHKAEVNAKNDLGNTALVAAQSEGHTEIVALLRKYGAR